MKEKRRRPDLRRIRTSVCYFEPEVSQLLNVAEGKVLIHCHAGCDQWQAIAALPPGTPIPAQVDRHPPDPDDRGAS